MCAWMYSCVYKIVETILAYLEMTEGEIKIEDCRMCFSSQIQISGFLFKPVLSKIC